MAYKVRLTEAAVKDLDNILTYIIDELLNKSAAARFFEVFQSKISSLAEQPLMYEYARDPYLRHKGYRKMVVDNYIVLYLVDDVVKTVFISRLFYGRQKYEDLV